MFFKKKYLDLNHTQLAEALEYSSSLDFNKEKRK